MTLVAAVVAVLLAQAPPDLSIRQDAGLGPSPGAASPRAPSARGAPLRAGELVGSGLGVLAGDAAFLGLAVGTYYLFTEGVVYPGADNFRRAAIGLAAAGVLLPPLAATLGGSLSRHGPTRGHAWKAFLLSMAGHAAALAVGYLTAPQYWMILPVQLATMTTGTAVGLHWGPPLRGASRAAGAEPAPAPPPLALSPGLCLDGA